MYDADRAAFIAAIMLCEAETALQTELGRKSEDWRKVHAAAMRLFQSYDRQINKGTIYDLAGKIVDDLNASIEKHTKEVV